MEMIKLFVILLSCVSTALIVENFMSFNFDRKAKGSYLLYFSMCIVLNTIVNLMGNTYLNYAWSFIYVLFVSLYLYESKKHNTFLFLAFLFISFIVEETLVCYFLEWFFIENGIPFDNFYYIAVFSSNILLITTYKPIKKFISTKSLSFNKNYLFEVILLLSSFVIIVLLSFFMRINLPSQALVILIFICIIIFLFDIYIVFVVEKINVNEKLKEEVKLIQLNQQISEKYYQSKLEQYHQQSKLFHDIKKHLSVIEKLYENNENDKAKSYSSELIKKMSYKSISLNNQVLRILINDFIDQCEMNNIMFEYDLDARIGFDNINDLDLVTIYSNLFTNSLEAVKKCNEPFVNLKMKIHNDMIITILSNSYTGTIDERSNKLYSTKDSHYGLGIENIIQTVERYNGIYDIKYNQSVFTFELILPMD